MLKYNLIILFLFFSYYIHSVDFALDTNGDKKIDRWVTCDVYKQWELLDLNKNNKPDESCFYVNEKGIVFLISEEKQDYNNDGKIDIYITISLIGNSGFKRDIKIDSNNDGKFDVLSYEENEFVYLTKYDTNFDGIFESMEEYYKMDNEIREEMVLKKIRVKKSEDINNDGKYDSFFITDKLYNNSSLFDEKTILQEIDSNYDGLIDIWVNVNYNVDGSLKDIITKIDNNFDGKADEWRYSNNRREVIKIEKDTNYDGKVDFVDNNPRKK